MGCDCYSVSEPNRSNEQLTSEQLMATVTVE